MNAFDLTYCLAVVALFPLRARKARGGWRERLGHAGVGEGLGDGGELRADGQNVDSGDGASAMAGRSRLLIHAVSVGEVSALRQLVPRLRREMDVVVAATTDTGIKRARELFGPGSECPGPVVRYPLDFSWSVRRFLDRVRPDAFASVELEVWPNFVRECERRGVPVGVINGRLSERSFRGYQRVRACIGPSFRRLTIAAVQDEAYAERFRAMGVAPERCVVTGSMKWDTAAEGLIELGGAQSAAAARVREQAERLAIAMGIDRTKPLVVAGSTAEGEEKLMHECCPVGTQLLCAPRKPERFDAAATDLPMCVRRSKSGDRAGAMGGGGGGRGGSRGALGMSSVRGRLFGDRFLLDSLGELRAAYALADVVVIGRSFTPLGGSDPLEAIGLGKATLIGPEYANFSTIVGLLVKAGAIKVVHTGQLRTELERLLHDPAARERMAEAGARCIRESAGATERHVEILRRLVVEGSRDRGIEGSRGPRNGTE
jgi:3-deoxy-D-manno-octulosonic-acid transferase